MVVASSGSLVQFSKTASVHYQNCRLDDRTPCHHYGQPPLRMAFLRPSNQTNNWSFSSYSSEAVVAYLVVTPLSKRSVRLDGHPVSNCRSRPSLQWKYSIPIPKQCYWYRPSVVPFRSSSLQHRL